ncbi:MAG TPA: 50S ribosomal protein L25 [Candidatus Pristimantibacillus sp.]|jgi:large subunit ribosomal protein L25|nr:50S ribosomal protein L25 [Candidatus Pristimantibacillus sp.]
MEEVLLEVQKRDVTGKAVKHLRRAGLVPAVIHDHGKESIHVEGEYLAMLKAYQKAGKHHPISLKAGGQNYTVLVRDIDVDPRKHQLRHVVFNAVKANEKVDAEIPVRIRFSEGNEATPAERAGLVVLHQLESVEVSALPRDLPDFLEFDGEKLVAVGDHATVVDLIVPSTVTIKTDPAHPLATVFEPSALQAANDAAGGTAEDTEAATEEVAEGSEAAGEAEAKSEENKE